jgi:hypothetical protein
VTRSPVYIAAPYGDPDPLKVARNVERAVWLGRLAVAEGLVPIVPHVLVPALTGPEDPARPEVRALALELGLDLLDTVARAGGDLWVLSRDDWSLSAGVEAELDRFRVHWRRHDARRLGRFDGLRPVLDRHPQLRADYLRLV